MFANTGISVYFKRKKTFSNGFHNKSGILTIKFATKIFYSEKIQKINLFIKMQRTDNTLFFVG